ncbi:DNA cytosine methyltransferase [uncultured Muribaculum sp.]|uniref:DNA cytosine methyltransferase n=2 Tax=uncultured Muribaculum sp. TaxID=1918613 RepID=UPI0026107E86|nr:DNA cytosine methyltransferase [uncultured Muribaculum sp.]
MKVVDLFCGCGGLSLGFEKAEMDIVASYDIWDAAIDVYNANFNHSAVKLNLANEQSAANQIGILRPDMIIGGPPCQDFSSAGLRNEDSGRGDLTLSYARIVSMVLPHWFVMENVSTITKTKKLAEAKTIFKSHGYGLTQIVLNAALCGVPQKRKRFFLIGKIGAQDDFLLSHLKCALSSKEMTLRDYFGDSLGVDYYYRHPRSYARRGIFSIDEPSPTIRGVNRPLPAGYKLHSNDPVKDLDGIRSLTLRERSMIQTFPETFNFFGSKSDVEQMIGNAVPVKLGTFVANAINKYMYTK